MSGISAACCAVAPGRLITWSPSVTLVPSRACFNACGYCSFRRDPEPGNPLADALSDAAADARLAAAPDATEVLLLSGEVAPDSPWRRAWFTRLLALSRRALAAGRLPHTNAGPLSLAEMAALARLNPSLGLMLEGVGSAWERWHGRAPSKREQVRLAQLEQAGRLAVPFTTGLLLGIGESHADRRRSLERLAAVQRRWGHLQEVILQPWRPDGDQARPLSGHERRDLLATIAEARTVLPPEVHLQLPPNLWPWRRLPEALAAGIDDLGGIDSRDVINPAYPQPRPGELQSLLAAAGWRLQPRLCVHDAWLPWLPLRLRRHAEHLLSGLRARHTAADC
ncbi:MAG: 7,8-didemethyl-8-hydroxy-5-deazariboflavin synthase subunit CofG [Synechococcaceae cyanobacterium]|nr:7,8-didemethyl-8-hydroxy-5-deazariboflavin synthase subunit CofG [Synechococcaceae cyanobacterium]